MLAAMGRASSLDGQEDVRLAATIVQADCRYESKKSSKSISPVLRLVV